MEISVNTKDDLTAQVVATDKLLEPEKHASRENHGPENAASSDRRLSKTSGKRNVEMFDILAGDPEFGGILFASHDESVEELQEEERRYSPRHSIETTLPENIIALRVSADSHGHSASRNHTLGVALILVHCVSLVSMAQLVKATYSKEFSAPFFLVFFRTAWRVVVFPVFMVLKWCWTKARNRKSVTFMKTYKDAVSVLGPQGLTVKSLLYPYGILSALWIFVQFSQVYSVKYLNNSIVQALYCTETAFCYVLSIIVLKTSVFLVKVAAVISALVGAALMAYSQVKDSSLRWEGTVLCVVGAVAGASYMVALKKIIGKSDDIGKALFLSSLMAAIATMFLWPVVLALYYTGVEYWNMDTFPWMQVGISTCLAVLASSVFNLCLALTSPLLATLSKLLGIPLNYGVDWLFWDHIFDWYQISGVVLIIVGFVFIVVPDRWVSVRIARKGRRDTLPVPVG